MIFTIEFFRIRLNDDAHATLDRLSVIVDDSMKLVLWVGFI